MGGPNQRADFHLEEGEELFYMRKGAMTLPILTEGAIRTVHIKEGDVFLLPGRSDKKQSMGKILTLLSTYKYSKDNLDTGPGTFIRSPPIYHYEKNVFFANVAEYKEVAGRHNLQSFLAANLTQNYFLIARMISFFVTFATKVPYLTFCNKM